MTLTSVPKNNNGRKPLAKSAPKPTLQAQIDQLADLRSLLRQSVAAEKELTAEVLGALQAAGLSKFEGGIATALVIPRTVLVPDPALFIEAVGAAKAYTAMRVSVEAARALMAGDDLAAISTTSTTPTLRLEARKAPALHVEPKAVRS